MLTSQCYQPLLRAIRRRVGAASPAFFKTRLTALHTLADKLWQKKKASASDRRTRSDAHKNVAAVWRFRRSAPEETKAKADAAARSQETPAILVLTPLLIKSDDN